MQHQRLSRSLSLARARLPCRAYATLATPLGGRALHATSATHTIMLPIAIEYSPIHPSPPHPHTPRPHTDRPNTPTDTKTDTYLHTHATLPHFAHSRCWKRRSRKARNNVSGSPVAPQDGNSSHYLLAAAVVGATRTHAYTLTHTSRFHLITHTHTSGFYLITRTHAPSHTLWIQGAANDTHISIHALGLPR